MHIMEVNIPKEARRIFTNPNQLQWKVGLMKESASNTKAAISVVPSTIDAVRHTAALHGFSFWRSKLSFSTLTGDSLWNI